jgi:hypothetical protein
MGPHHAAALERQPQGETGDLLCFLLDQAGVEIDIFLARVLGETETVASALESDPTLAGAVTDLGLGRARRRDRSQRGSSIAARVRSTNIE